MSTADDLARASASVHAGVGIPVKRFGEVPPPAEPRVVAPAPQATLLQRAVGTACWILMTAFALGLVYRFGH